MRYFEINLGENAEYIEENARIKYRDYSNQKVLDGATLAREVHPQEESLLLVHLKL